MWNSWSIDGRCSNICLPAAKWIVQALTRWSQWVLWLGACWIHWWKSVQPNICGAACMQFQKTVTDHKNLHFIFDLPQAISIPLKKHFTWIWHPCEDTENIWKAEGRIWFPSNLQAVNITNIRTSNMLNPNTEMCVFSTVLPCKSPYPFEIIQDKILFFLGWALTVPKSAHFGLPHKIVAPMRSQCEISWDPIAWNCHCGLEGGKQGVPVFPRHLQGMC